MLKEVIEEIENAKEKLNYLISVYGLAHKKLANVCQYED